MVISKDFIKDVVIDTINNRFYMLDNTSNNNLLGNTYIGSNLTHRDGQPKMSVNKYYNIFTQKLEEMALPDVDFEFNNPIKPELSTFSRFT